jgi:hypothetical protein
MKTAGKTMKKQGTQPRAKKNAKKKQLNSAPKKNPWVTMIHLGQAAFT